MGPPKAEQISDLVHSIQVNGTVTIAGAATAAIFRNSRLLVRVRLYVGLDVGLDGARSFVHLWH